MKNRVLKINELIKKELGGIILKEIDVPQKSIVTITRIETMPNLKQAYAYVSVIGEDEQRILNILNHKIYNIQHSLNKKLNMRPVPKIIFKQEKETEKAARIEELLEKIKEK